MHEFWELSDVQDSVPKQNRWAEEIDNDKESVDAIYKGKQANIPTIKNQKVCFDNSDGIYYYTYEKSSPEF
jgi:hypothetical protein